MTLPTQGQLLLPTLESLAELGGQAPAAAVIDAVSTRLGIPDAVKNDFRDVDCGKWGKRRRSAWRQRLHVVRLNAVLAGLIEKHRSGYWTLSDKGRGSLVKCQPGVIVTVYTTEFGEVLWADAVTAAGALADNSVQLLFTSTPYPLAGAGRKYGNLTPAETVDLVVKCAMEWKRALRDDGSIILNLRDVWLPKAQTGGAVRSLYMEKLLIALSDECRLFFSDRFYWTNPVSMGDSWVTIRRVRVRSSVEQLLWLSKGPNPKANNRAVMVDASPTTLETYRRKGRTGQKAIVCPSGHKNIFEAQIAAAMAGQELKVIPSNLLRFTNSDPRTILHGRLDELGLPRHDAKMPEQLASWFIRFLTEEGDLVVDPFSGSGTTAREAERLKRRFIGSDFCLAHCLGSAARWKPEEINYVASDNEE